MWCPLALPVTVMLRGLPEALSVMTSVEDLLPFDVGVNVTLMWQVTPLSTEPAQSLLVENCAASPPENAMLEMVMVDPL